MSCLRLGCHKRPFKTRLSWDEGSAVCIAFSEPQQWDLFSDGEESTDATMLSLTFNSKIRPLKDQKILSANIQLRGTRFKRNFKLIVRKLLFCFTVNSGKNLNSTASWNNYGFLVFFTFRRHHQLGKVRNVLLPGNYTNFLFRLFVPVEWSRVVGPPFCIFSTVEEILYSFNYLKSLMKIDSKKKKYIYRNEMRIWHV